MSRDTLLVSLTGITAALFIASGLWAFFDARSFFEQAATFEPYNEHFTHDLGAFQIGLGAVLAAALARRGDAIFAGLAGVGIGSAFHAAGHLRDHDLGGNVATTVVLMLVALLLLAGAAWRVLPQRR